MRRTGDAAGGWRTTAMAAAALVLCATAGRAQQLTPFPQTPPPIPQTAAPLPSAAAAVPAISAAGVAPPPAPSMLQMLSTARRSCCARLRSSPLGQLVAGLRKPLSVVTGGLVPAEQAPHADDLAQPGPQGTAAQVQAAAFEAPKRQAAVKQLAGVDVRYHPEAEATLIAALRADPAECVRLQAAKTIASLPVCTPPLAQALRVCVESSFADGNPAELSDSVRLQASVALSHCQNCLPAGMPDVLPRPEYPAVRDKGTPHDDPVAGNAAERQPLRPVSWFLQHDVDPATLLHADMLISDDIHATASYAPAPARLPVPTSASAPVKAPAPPTAALGLAVPSHPAAPPVPVDDAVPTNLLDVFRAALREPAAD